MIASLCGTLALFGCSETPGLGGACDPAAGEGACAADYVCAPDMDANNVCQIPFGGTCEVGSDPSGCRFGSECRETTELVDGEEVMVGRCLIVEGGACDPESPLCADEYTCAELVDGSYECHTPFVFRGRVLDSEDLSGIADAHVLALDDESVAVTDIAISEADGAYELEVPVVRDAEGVPIEANYTLRGSADGYQAFPGGIRTALPINTTSAVEEEGAYVVEGTITDVVLIPLADPDAPRISVSGQVVADGPVGGVLVVAAGDSAISAVSDRTGAYTIFNVTPGAYEVRGYAADLQLTPVDITAADADLTGVDLLASEAPLTTVNGSINLVNPEGGSVTSVVLVVEDTFSDVFGRGEVPPGLRAPRTGPVSITGAWTIEGVPDGRYVVLAAFENDLLVRDPDENIAGTDYVILDLPDAGGATVDLATSFKVTGAMGVISPGAERPEAVTAAPLLSWERDSSTAFYTVDVYNAYGDLVWNVDRIDPGDFSGSDPITAQYDGPLEVGMYYQFRATSWREPGGTASPISTTEDLLGVFFVAP